MLPGSKLGSKFHMCSVKIKIDLQMTLVFEVCGLNNIYKTMHKGERERGGERTSTKEKGEKEVGFFFMRGGFSLCRDML